MRYLLFFGRSASLYPAVVAHAQLHHFVAVAGHHASHLLAAASATAIYCNTLILGLYRLKIEIFSVKACNKHLRGIKTDKPVVVRVKID